MWGRDFTMGPDIASVRQNLALMIDNGQLDPALDENDTSKWGATLGNKALVWRSGVGVDANGALIYAGGPSLSVLSLARTLQNAGAVRAMELDINTDWVSAYTYVNDPATDPNAPVIGLKLGGDMSRGGDRYLQLGERDFFAFFADPKAPPAAAPSDHHRSSRPRPRSRAASARQPTCVSCRVYIPLLTQVGAEVPATWRRGPGCRSSCSSGGRSGRGRRRRRGPGAHRSGGRRPRCGSCRTCGRSWSRSPRRPAAR